MEMKRGKEGGRERREEQERGDSQTELVRRTLLRCEHPIP